MTNKPTQKERLEQLFAQMELGNAYITDSATSRVSKGRVVTQVNKLDVSWSGLGRADDFYKLVLPALDKAGFAVQDLHLTDQDGETKATFEIDKE